MSNLFSASSIFVLLLPNSFFRYFSKNSSVNADSTGNCFVQKRLTRSALLHFFRCNSNDVEDFRHYFRDRIHHFLIQCRFNVKLQSSEKGFQALEYLKKSALACTHVLSCLRGEITMGGTNILERIHTKRRTPTAVKMAFAGGNACQISVRARISDKFMS
jgi:hypothetical protein